MTLAATCFDNFPGIPNLDRAVGEDSIEIQRIRSFPTEFETSISFGLSKTKGLEDLLDAISEASESDRDEFGAAPTNPDSIVYAMQFLEHLSSNLPSPEIIVDNYGDIAIEWDYGPRRLISVRVGRDGTLTYAGIDGHSIFHGVEIHREGIPRSIFEGIERIATAPVR